MRELKQERRTQTETNAVFSKVLTSQGAAQKRSEETAVLYSYEFTGLPGDDTQEDKRAFVMWCTSEANIPDHEISAIGHTDVKRVYGVQTAIIKFGDKGDRTKMSKWMQFFKAGNPLKYHSRGEVWGRYKIAGRCQETADQRERRDFLNVAWQILKELEGEDRFKSEEGTYLNYAKASINDKADNLPLVQCICQEVTEGRIIDPTVRVYIDKCLWGSEFEIKFRQHYLREEEEQEERESERRVGKEGAAGSSTDYTVPHSMVRDKVRVRTWRMVFHKSEAIEHHYPKFWEDVQIAASEITMKGKGWQREGGFKGGCKGQNQYKGGYKGQDKGGYQGKNQAQKVGKCKGKQYPQNPQNPQNPFVASAQASEADQRGKGSSQADQQAGVLYVLFQGMGPGTPGGSASSSSSCSSSVSISRCSCHWRSTEGGAEGSRIRAGGPDPSDPPEKST